MHLAILYTQYRSDRALVIFLLKSLELETFIVVEYSSYCTQSDFASESLTG